VGGEFRQSFGNLNGKEEKSQILGADFTVTEEFHRGTRTPKAIGANPSFEHKPHQLLNSQVFGSIPDTNHDGVLSVSASSSLTLFVSAGVKRIGTRQPTPVVVAAIYETQINESQTGQESIRYKVGCKNFHW